MVNQSRWNVSGATVFQLVAEIFLVVVAVLFALQLRGISIIPLLNTVTPAIVFAVLMVLLQGAFGLYRRDRKLGIGAYAVRLFVCMLIGAPIAYLTADLLPGGGRFRDDGRRFGHARLRRSGPRSAAGHLAGAEAGACRTACWCSAPARRRGSSRPR